MEFELKRVGAINDPGHSVKSVDGRLHLNTHRPLTQRSWSEPTMPQCGSLSGNELTRSSSGSFIARHCGYTGVNRTLN